MFLENAIVYENSVSDEGISKAKDNDHTAAMKAPIEKKRKKKNAFAPGMITVCMLCQKAFKNPLLYRKHLRVHIDKTNQCPICRETFLKKHHLYAHLHSIKHNYQCPYCQKRFCQKGNLNQHMKFHGTKKVFKCTLCDKDFYQQEHLKTHLRHHNNERPFECELCHKAFNIKSSLQRHMNCHTGEKPFICDICNRGYTRRSVLMLHIQQVHENKKPFQCDECQLCFSQKGNLQAHFRRKHLQGKSSLDGKRVKDRESKMKRAMKRRNKAAKMATQPDNESYDDLPRFNNTSLHSYASKVKAIINRGSKAQVSDNNQRTFKLIKPVISYDSIGEEEVGESPSHSPQSLDSSSSCSLSDGAVDIGCSSSPENIPEVNFPIILENQGEPSYFDALLNDDKTFDDLMLTDNDMILGTYPSYENDAFISPIKNVNQPKERVLDGAYLTSLAEDCANNPLFSIDDMDDIKELTNMCGINYNPFEYGDVDKKIRNGHTSRIMNHPLMAVKKEN